ncbi:hypothetical protein [Pseudovibrio ascidiaceicola]|uniref:hypothetical protein n=1 Tax=Pseudovibrio ascidiaceicola TaxID=285279 RepID=UPI00135B52DB|nr:hypothetical protein [Pseudovibrio ascidiaceicola]
MDFQDRLKEPSTMAGASMFVMGLSQLSGVGEPEQVAQVANAVVREAANQNWLGAGMAALLGLAAMFMKEGPK